MPNGAPKTRRLRAEPLTPLDGFAILPERFRPFAARVVNAYFQVLDKGLPPTYTNLAKALGRSRQAVWEVFQRHPELRAWIDGRAHAAGVNYVGSILYRHSMLAIQGQVASAELVLKHHAGAFARAERGDVMDGATVIPGATFNFLVPAPPIPQQVQEQAQQRLPPPMTWDATLPADIPTVKTR